MTITQQMLATMPAPDMTKLTRGAYMYASQIVRSDGTLYASKPGGASVEAQYIWRMVVHLVSPRQRHQCMPVTADWGLAAKYGYKYSERKAVVAELDALVDQIVDSIPVAQWHGVRRWAGILC